MVRPNTVLLSIALLLAVSCKASFPASPSATTGIVAMQLMIRDTVDWPVSVNTRIRVEAVALDVHGEYRSVTYQANWTSSAPSIVQIGPVVPRNVEALRDGLAEITATYEGFRSSLVVPVSPPPRIPHLAIRSIPFSSVKFVGDTQTLQVEWRTSSSTREDVTAAAVLRSSDPRIATVDAARLTAREPGNVEITASYDGMAAAIRFSVFPPGCC
jgi:hypothetical protein